MFLKFIGVICLGLFFCGWVCSQNTVAPQSAIIQGEVVGYEIGAMIVDAKITVSNKSLRLEARSDSSGRYAIRVPFGIYVVEVESLAYKRFRRKNVKIETKLTFTFNVNMDWDESSRVDEKHP